jgi:low temperature requirement protein LtrA
MSTPGSSPNQRHWMTRMAPRSPEEPHRAATPLELFFDLVFVVAIAQAAAGLHHAVADDHAAEGLFSYAMVFFAIWWAWMNFTWFASAYDTDDVAYRLVVFVQLAGALILAAGLDSAFETRTFTVPTLGYVVMRVAMVTQWLRAAQGDPPRRRTAHRYAAGITLCQLGWVGLLFAPQPAGLAGFFLLAAAELAVPVWAERAGATPWHAEHIVERYGLMTIIVLGESILAASIAVRAATAGEAGLAGLGPLCAGGILIVFSLWWLYFERLQHDLHESFTTAFVWGYGHLPIYAAGAAVGAGIAVSVDQSTGRAAVGPVAAGAALAIPVALYLLCLWLLHVRPRRDGWGTVLVPAFAALILATTFTAQPVLITGLLCATLLAIKLATGYGAARP